MIFRAVEDTDLIIRIRRGDVEAFNLLVSRWEKRVFNYLLRLTGDPDDALDLSQDVFLKAYQNIRKLDDTARFGPWLFRIAHNEAYSLFRKSRPEGGRRTRPSSTGSTRRGVAPELAIAVATALARLNPEQREAVELKVYQGFRFEEMAEILECPVSTVKSRLYTALDLMKAELAPIQYPRYPMSTCTEAEALRDYAFDEMAAADRPSMEQHLATCADCAAELDQLRLTTAALRILPDREIPQRIAFVSDKVFHPSPVARFFGGFWNSAARLGFASPCVLAVALMVVRLASGPAPVIRLSARTAACRCRSPSNCRAGCCAGARRRTPISPKPLSQNPNVNTKKKTAC